jgi:hypothetical protein
MFKSIEGNKEDGYLIDFFSNRGLFIVGHARSGTSVLVDALNTSNDIYCLTESFFYSNLATNNMGRHFNAIQRRNGVPKFKSTYAPDFGDSWSILGHLARTHKLVGEKLAFRLDSLGYDMNNFFDYSNKYFPASHYVCVVRDPLYVIASNIDMFSSGIADEKSLLDTITSQLETYSLIVSLATTLPNVYLLQHEAITSNTFKVLSRYLDCDLSQAYSAYSKEYKKYENITESIKNRQDLNLLNLAYSSLLNIFDTKKLKIKDHYSSRMYLFHIENEIKRRKGEPSAEKFGVTYLPNIKKKTHYFSKYFSAIFG